MRKPRNTIPNFKSPCHRRSDLLDVPGIIATDDSIPVGAVVDVFPVRRVQCYGDGADEQEIPFGGGDGDGWDEGGEAGGVDNDCFLHCDDANKKEMQRSIGKLRFWIVEMYMTTEEDGSHGGLWLR